MSAIFYPVDGVMDIMKTIININPVYSYIAFAREIVLQGTCPELMRWIQMIGWGVGSFLVGYFIFHKQENKVMQRV